MNHVTGHGMPGDIEMLERACGLRTVVAFRIDLNFSKAVRFDSVVH
jgi:hypothetical protein